MSQAADQTPDQLRRENLYLRQRVAQLEADKVDLAAELVRAQQERERLHGRRAAAVPNPLGGGQ
jgi:hypothetical protein